MKAKAAMALFCSFFLFSFTGYSPAQAGEHAPAPPGTGVLAHDSVTPDMSRQVRETYKSATNGPGAAILVVRDAEVLLKDAFGLANLELEVPITTDTVFRIGSITKCFTAVAILRLHEEGRLNIAHFLNMYLPDAPHAGKITVRHLLSHTSGLAGKHAPLAFTPGEQIDYSNEGYILLGQIIEKVSGKKYADYLKETIFDPLGMTNSGYDRPESILRHRSSGYMYGPDGRAGNAPYTDMTGPFSAGGLYSTVEDLRLFDEALHSGKILKRDTLNEAFTPVKLSGGREGAYGYGWMINRHRGVLELAHGGDFNGFNSYLARYPEHKLTVIVLENVSLRPPGPLPSAGDIARRIAEVYLREHMEEGVIAQNFSVEPAQLDRYTGTFEYLAPESFLERTGKTLVLTHENGRLFGEDKTGKLQLLPQGPGLFAPPAGPVKIEFRGVPGAKATEAVLSIGGLKEIILRRIQ